MPIYIPAVIGAAGRYNPINLMRNEILCVVEKKNSVKKKLVIFLPE
jgi:hypothetical protein